MLTRKLPLVVDASGRELIHLIQRFDRPLVEVLAESLPPLAKQAAQPMIALGSQSVIIAVSGDENPGLVRRDRATDPGGVAQLASIRTKGGDEITAG